MPIDLLQHLDAHAQIARRLPSIRAGLHQPSSGSAPKCVGGHLAGETGKGSSTSKASFNGPDSLSVELEATESAGPRHAFFQWWTASHRLTALSDCSVQNC